MTLKAFFFLFRFCPSTTAVSQSSFLAVRRLNRKYIQEHTMYTVYTYGRRRSIPYGNQSKRLLYLFAFTSCGYLSAPARHFYIISQILIYDSTRKYRAKPPTATSTRTAFTCSCVVYMRTESFILINRPFFNTRTYAVCVLVCGLHH